MTTRIMLRISCRDDVVLTLKPGMFVPVSLGPGLHGPITHFSVLLVEDDAGDVTPRGIRVPVEVPGVGVQPELLP